MVVISKRKVNNVQNEKDNDDNRLLLKEGKANPWERVIENISIKESDYKGSKNVSRMRTCITNRKNDAMSNSTFT